jgi:hypothetical protein
MKFGTVKASLVVISVLLMILGFFIVSVKAGVDEVDTYFETVRGELLAFYGSEIVSHSAIILGLLIGFTQIGTLWNWLFEHGKRTFWRYFVWSCVFVLILALIMYSVGRLIYWSELVGYLIHTTRTNMEDVITESNVTSSMLTVSSHIFWKFQNENSPMSKFAYFFYPRNSLCWFCQVLLVLLGFSLLTASALCYGSTTLQKMRSLLVNKFTFLRRHA